MLTNLLSGGIHVSFFLLLLINRFINVHLYISSHGGNCLEVTVWSFLRSAYIIRC